MTAKELERLLAARGAYARALNTVTRSLRAAMKEGHVEGLPTGGRGLGAPDLTAAQTAWTLMAYAGSEVAAQAGRAVLHYSQYFSRSVEKFGRDPCFEYLGTSLNVALQEMLQRPALLNEIHSVRFARNLGLVTVVLKDRREVHYVHIRRDPSEVEAMASQSFASEGVISNGLLTAIAEEAAWFQQSDEDVPA